MSEFRARSFDAFRVRPAPTVLHGRSLRGDDRFLALRRNTLVVAVKPDCDGCRDFVHGELRELAEVEVVVVSATTGDAEWADAVQPILVAPELLHELGIRSAPFYVLIDSARSLIVAEGSIFSPAQVASEIASFLTPGDVTRP
ncbi:MAG TPA: hypothetical protein VNF08_08410 [Acidimicrobiales bacterium]|nr:hypothetical protein [Acidimicrobiales bacterium]